MTNRTTVHLMMQVAALTLSLGLWGYILWYVGGLDILLSVLIFMGLAFPFIMVMLNIISEETFNESVDKLNAVKATILAGVEKAKGNKVA